MEESGQNFPKKIWLRWVVLTAIVLIAALSLLDAYQIRKIEAELVGIKTKIESWGKIIPSIAPTVFPAPTVGEQEPIEVIGIIQYSNIEGGCWSIQPEFPECKGDKCPLGMPANYEPINLPPELKKAGLRAKLKLEVQPEVATICQIGPVVKILDYQIVK